MRLLLSPPRELIHLPPEHDRRVHILGSLPLFQTFIAILVNCNVGSGNHEEPSNHLDVGTPDVIAFPQHPHRLPLPTMAIFLGQDYLAYHLQIFPRQFALQASPKNFQGFPTCPAQSNNAPVGRNNHNALKASSSQRETSRRRLHTWTPPPRKPIFRSDQLQRSRPPHGKSNKATEQNKGGGLKAKFRKGMISPRRRMGMIDDDGVDDGLENWKLNGGGARC